MGRGGGHNKGSYFSLLISRTCGHAWTLATPGWVFQLLQLECTCLCHGHRAKIDCRDTGLWGGLITVLTMLAPVFSEHSAVGN